MIRPQRPSQPKRSAARNGKAGGAAFIRGRNRGIYSEGVSGQRNGSGAANQEPVRHAGLIYAVKSHPYRVFVSRRMRTCSCSTMLH